MVCCFESLSQWSRNIFLDRSHSTMDVATQQKCRDGDGIQDLISSLKESLTKSPEFSTKQDDSSIKLKDSIESSLNELKDVIMSSITIQSSTSHGDDDRMFASREAAPDMNLNSSKNVYSETIMKDAAESIKLLKQHMETFKNCIKESDKVMDNLNTIETNQASLWRDVAALECMKENIPIMVRISCPYTNCFIMLFVIMCCDVVQEHMVQEIYSSYEMSLLTSMTHEQLDSYHFIARTLHMEWIGMAPEQQS